MSHTETQQTIAEWADATFGPSTPLARFRRAMVEANELRDALSLRTLDTKFAPAADDIAKELADVFICLYGLASTLCVDIHEVIDAKMAVNRARKWVLNGDGTGQHLKEDK